MFYPSRDLWRIIIIFASPFGIQRFIHIFSALNHLSDSISCMGFQAKKDESEKDSSPSRAFHLVSMPAVDFTRLFDGR